MNLKEAFRYQNTLSHLIDATIDFLSRKSNITVVTQDHMRKKANPEAQDEKVTVERDRTLAQDNNTVLLFLDHLVEEKSKLSAAISKAKASCDFDLDAELANNKTRQRVKACLDAMARIRPDERTVSGRAYKFNADGEQVPYAYDVKQVTSIDFDRNKVRASAKKYQKEADDVSTKIDRLMVDVEVAYVPEFSPTDTFDDAIATWDESRGK